MQVPYILTISLRLLVSPSLNKANLPTALQAGKRGKKYSIVSFALINGYFFLFFLFILFRFKNHQTRYISVSSAHSFNQYFAITFNMILKFVLPYSM